MRRPILLALFLSLIVTSLSQSASGVNANGFIETRKLFLFDPSTGFQANQQGILYSFGFEKTFTLIPRVGLAVYTMDFEYSPSFSCKLTSNTSTTTATLNITTDSLAQNNQLYIMYLATDHTYMGVYMPGTLATTKLARAINNQNSSQDFQFNFKEQISTSSAINNIRLSVYLTGIISTSELVSNGYDTNHTDFTISAKIISNVYYNITVTVHSIYGDITITSVEYTIVYFDITQMFANRYQMDSSAVSSNNFGGTLDVVTTSVTIPPLASLSTFGNLEIFFGISSLECKQGTSITLLGVEKYFILSNESDIRVLLQFQTWKLTLMLSATYNYVQLKSLNCDQPNSNCDNSCATGNRPHFIVNNLCSYCQYSCITCNISNSQFKCDTCDPATRILSTSTKLCGCLPSFYDDGRNSTCQSCYPCLTCDVKNRCNSCNATLQLIQNPVLFTCVCNYSYYPNYVSANTLSTTQPCLPCSPHCIYCLNFTTCIACDLTTFLTNGLCLPMCLPTQKFTNNTSQCSFSGSNLFDQIGRLGYTWTYRNNGSQMLVDVTFSQPNISYYYYEGGQAYTYSTVASNATSAGAGQFYFDDGTNMMGYGTGTISGIAGSNSASTSGSAGISTISGEGGLFGGGKNSINSSAAIINGNLLNLGLLDQSALNGDYYGLGETRFFTSLYNQYIYQQITTNQTLSYQNLALTGNNISSQYRDQYGLPFGKYNLTTKNVAIPSPSFTDALARNLVFSIGNQSVPFTVIPVSNNQFTLVTTPTRSYSGDVAALSLKNPALVRSGNTTVQTSYVTQSVYLYNCQIPSYVNSAQGIRDSNSIIVQVLWGIGKYPLFIGFGWCLMPLMLVLQYIMNFNYIQTEMPLNLNYFLSSFQDFRNPSILYNPLRRNMDASVVNHPQLYTVVPPYYVFDRGVDFMKNCFQFFFVPFLSFCLLFLFVVFNKLVNVCCQRDISLISNYLVPRIPLHIGAYTLVQAIPIAFFFFAQLNYTKYSSPLQPNGSYLTFNTAMSYGAFFATCAIPLMMFAYIYYSFSSKENKVNNATDFRLMFLNLIESKPNQINRASLEDPLWSGDPNRVASYGFGISVFYLAIIAGFATSFFIFNYPWQLTTLILSAGLFLAFAAASNHFTNNIFKYFWIIFSVLMIAFLLLLAGIGSNRSTTSCDQENLGFLGIGLLYALMLAALIFSGYLVWLTARHVYENHIRDGRFLTNLNAPVMAVDGKSGRVSAFHSNTTRLKSMYMKNPMSVIGGGLGGRSQLNIGGQMIQSTNVIGGVGVIPIHDNVNINDDLHSQDRLVIREREAALNNREKLQYAGYDNNSDLYNYRSIPSNRLYAFSSEFGKMLKDNEPLQVDGLDNIYGNSHYLGNYGEINRIASLKKMTIRQQQLQPSSQSIDVVYNVPGAQNNSQSNVQLINYGPPSQSIQMVNLPQANRINENNIVLSHTNINPSLGSQEQLINYNANGPSSSSQNIIMINRNNVPPSQGQISSRNIVVGDSQNNINFIRNNKPPSTKVIQHEIFEIQGEQFEKEGEDNQGHFFMRNIRTNEIKTFDAHLFNESNIEQEIEEEEVGQFRQVKPPSAQFIEEENIISQWKNRKIIINNEEFIERGKDLKSKAYILENAQTHQIIQIPLQKYIEYNLGSLDRTVSRKGVNYNVGKMTTNTVYLIDNNGKTTEVTLEEFNRIRDQNISSFEKFLKKMYGVQMSTEEFTTVYRNRYINSASGKASQNSLLIQSQVGKRPTNTDSKAPLLPGIKATGSNIYYNNQIPIKIDPPVKPMEEEYLPSDSDEMDIETVLQGKGPFQMFVIPIEKVKVVNDEDQYDKEDAREKITVPGSEVLRRLQIYRSLYPNCGVFMVDLSDEEEYRLL